MKQIKTIFQLDNEGSAYQFQVVTGADTGKDYLFTKNEPGGFKYEFIGTEQDYEVVMKDLVKAKITVFVYPVWEEALKPTKNVTKPSKE